MTTKCPRPFPVLAPPLAARLSAGLTALFAGFMLIAPSFAQDKPNTPPPAQQQTPPPSSQKPATISTTTTNVVVPVTVKDKTGNLVADLKKDEFRIFEDGVEQINIISLSTEPVPLSMVVLIDNDLKQKDADQVEPSLRAIVGGLSVNDEASICRFDQFFHEGAGFTKDQEKLVTQLRRTKLDARTSAPPPGDPFSGGPTINGQPAPGADPLNYPSTRAIQAQANKALDDAVWSGAQLLKDRSSEKRRKIILIISDGQNGKKFNTHSYNETRAELLRQGIAVYSVATGSSYFERKLNRLEEYAHDTGGDVYFGAKSSTFENFYSVIAEEARNQYTLVYSPQGDRKIDYHTIEVRVRREGLTILTRRGYYGGTFASSAR
jgi:Ca-activated chloride channel homolog